jgi:hypothetical protein
VQRDAGDNILVEDMATDNDIGVYIATALNPKSYMLSWYLMGTKGVASDKVKAAAKKVRIYSDTPNISHLDLQGREILSIKGDNSDVRQTLRSEIDAAGNVTVVFDTLNRTVSKSKYDLCQRCVYRSQIDGRVDLALSDTLGLDWLNWAQGQEDNNRQRTEHDGLGRPWKVRL